MTDPSSPDDAGAAGAAWVLRVGTAGPLTTVQDRGRAGLAHLGVPRAGPLDVPAAEFANRLVGNPPDAALLEVTAGGLTFTLERPSPTGSDDRAGHRTGGVWLAVTGAVVPLTVDGVPRGCDRAEWVPAGARVRLGAPAYGVRSCVAVAGGIVVPPVLGSRATDTLAWVGPPPVRDGVRLPVGEPYAPPVPLDTPRRPTPGPLRVRPGPRADWFAADALDRLCAVPYVVTDAANRVGLRLEGAPIGWARDGELASEGIVLGAVQVPPNGEPVVFLADHPTTGGYPVLAVVEADDLWQCVQLRPGEAVRFARVRSA